MAIVDNGTVESPITVTGVSGNAPAALKVGVDVRHTYRGDLKVTLTHGTVTKVIFNQAGGSADDLKQTFTLADFSGAQLSGAWTLKVEDTYAQDVGKLNGWTLEVTTR